MEAHEHVWIRVTHSVACEHGVFYAGQVCNLPAEQIKKITAAVNTQRQRRPKAQRSGVKPFKYEVVPAPWQTAADPDLAALGRATYAWDTARSELERLLAEQKAKADAAADARARVKAIKAAESEDPYKTMRVRKAAAEADALAAEVELLGAAAREAIDRVQAAQAVLDQLEGRTTANPKDREDADGTPTQGPPEPDKTDADKTDVAPKAPARKPARQTA